MGANLRLCLPTDKPPKPKCIGTKGIDHEGVNVVFDKPCSLNPDMGACDSWHVEYRVIGDALMQWAGEQFKKARKP